MLDHARPLDFLSVVDFGLGISAALAAHILADAGAKIRRVEPSAGDPFYEGFPAYAVWRRGAEISKAETLPKAIVSVSDTLAAADVCLIGGEDYPGLDWKTDVEELARRYPKLVILQITGFPHGSPEADEPSVDLFAQAYTGLVHEQSSKRPMMFAHPAPSYGAAMQGLIATLAAVFDRGRTGKGQIARTSLFEGALNGNYLTWFSAERSDWALELFPPKDSGQLMFRCADGKYLQFSLITGNALEYCYEILGIPFDKTGISRGIPDPSNPRNFYGDVDLLQSYIIKLNRQELLEQLWAKGLSAEPVNPPGEAWSDEQVAHVGIIQREADGTRRVGQPFKFKFTEPSDHRSAGKKADDAPPLQGVRIVDFGTFAAGPHASMLLGDLGADVIKVEATGGDPIHIMYRPYSTSSRGKRHVAIDLKNPQGLEIALRLSRSADAVHHNFRPGAAQRLGIDAVSLQRLMPSLVVLENSGYGATGPKALKAGIDYPLQAFCGHEVHGGGESGELICYNQAIIDYACGELSAIATLMGLLVKQRTGEGVAIETSLLVTGLFLLSELIQAPDGNFLPLPKINHDLTGFHPAERLYKAKDSWIAIAARGEEMSRRLVAVLGLEHKITAERRAWGPAEAETIAAAVAQKDSASLLAALKAGGVWAALSRNDPQKMVVSDPFYQERGMVVSSEHEKYGRVLQLGALFTLSGTKTTPSGVTPPTGTHTKEVLRELRYGEDQIAKFSEARVIKAL